MVVNVLIECKEGGLDKTIKNLKKKGFAHDESYEPIPAGKKDSVIIRGAVKETKIPDLEKIAGVLGVWRDVKIEPF